MPDIQGIIAIIGAIALFAGLFGGFRAKDLEVPALPKALRFSAFLIGVVFIGIAIWPFVRKEILTASPSPITPTVTNTSELAMTPTFTPELLPTDTLIPLTPVLPTNTAIPPTPVRPTNTPILPTLTPRSDILPNGEVVSPETLANLIGGNPAYWTKRGPVVWGYWDKGNNATFRHPGNNTILTYWAGFSEPRNAGDCLIVTPQADNLTRYVKCPSGTQAEFEADGVGFHLIDYTGFFQ